MCLPGQPPRRSNQRPSGVTANDNNNPAPLSLRQLRALGGAIARELSWGLAAVAREVRAWKARASEIPDPSLRAEALRSLARKRGHTDGAALLSTIPRARNVNLLRLLVAYEIVWDFLDGVNERSASAGQDNGRQLHRALIDALDVGRPPCDYYRLHPSSDGGYLHTLVAVCREHCCRLHSYSTIRPLLVREALHAQVLAVNHELDPRRRDADLRAWAAGAFPDASAAASWFELSGAASASLTIHALLALGAQPCNWHTLDRAREAYFPWISAATTMLDSYVDRAEDLLNGDHSYVSHYGAPQLAARRVRALIERSLQEARSLRDGERHAVIVACMVAMYLAKDSARARELDALTENLIDAGGSLTRLLHPILRLWRIAYAQRRH